MVRTSRPITGNTSRYVYPYNPHYYNRYYYSYGYGLGYFSYDPYYRGYPLYTYSATGSLRLVIKPAYARVYIDSYFAGTVDNYDNLFQRLRLCAGPHKVQVTADGFESAQFDILVIPDETITYKGSLRPRQSVQ